MNILVPARIGHDVGLAAWFGGALMGAHAMNAATREVYDHTQRTRVANAGWFRWAPIVALSIAAHVLGAVGLGRLGRRGRGLVRTRTILTVGAVAATIETGRSGRAVVSAGDVPVATAVEPIAATPPGVAAAMRRLRLAQWAVPLLTGLVWIVDGVQPDSVSRRTTGEPKKKQR